MFNLVCQIRIHFRRLPGRSGGYHLPSHEEYEPRLGLYPRTPRLSDDLEPRVHQNMSSIHTKIGCYWFYGTDKALQNFQYNHCFQKHGPKWKLIIKACNLSPKSNVYLIEYMLKQSLTGQFADSIGLTVVLAHVGVYKVDNVRADGSLEHGRHNDIFA